MHDEERNDLDEGLLGFDEDDEDISDDDMEDEDGVFETPPEGFHVEDEGPETDF